MRYSRQTLVEQLGSDGQTALAEARVVIIGAGGLGCTVGAQLAGAGIGEINIVDHDTVDISNLHRQILFRESDIGQSKAHCAAREMMALNNDIKVNAIDVRLNPSNVNELGQGMTVVIDAADNFATSYLLSDACRDLAVPLLTASVNRTFGYVGQFCGTERTPLPSLRAAFPKLPAQQTSCDTVGVTGPSVGAVASIQAQEAIKIIVGDKSQLAGKLLYLDLWNYSQHIIDFTEAPEPNDAQIALISEQDISDNDIVLDVRTEQEILNAPYAFTSLVISEPEIGKQRIVCACKSGQRALAKAQNLIDKGHSNVAALMPD